MNCINKSIKFIVLIGYFLISTVAEAGSYEDFFKAIQLDQAHEIQGLLQRGFDPNTVNPEGTPALLKALQEQSFKAAQALLDSPQIKPEVRSVHDESPLMLAALRGQEALAVRLVSLGAVVNKAGWTPLHYAATGGQLRLAAFLVGAGADVNAESPNGTTPLMMAAMYGNSQVVKLLLESGAEAYPRNDQGLSALDFAAKAGREDSAKLIQQVLDR
jgi:uncharacterized protein